MVVTPFQMDLRNGMSLEDALKKHDMTLKQAVFQSPRHRKSLNWKKSADMKNIYKNGESYTISKQQNGITKSFGTYKNVSDAQMVRDYLDNYGWEQLDVGLICVLLGVKRLKKNK